MDSSHSTTPEARIDRLLAFEAELRIEIKRGSPVPIKIADAQLILDVQRTRHRYEGLVEAERLAGNLKCQQRPAA